MCIRDSRNVEQGLAVDDGQHLLDQDFRNRCRRTAYRGARRRDLVTPDRVGRFEGQDQVLFDALVQVVRVLEQAQHGQLLPPVDQGFLPIQDGFGAEGRDERGLSLIHI